MGRKVSDEWTVPLLAPHRGLESIGSVLRLCFPAILGSQEFLRGVDCLGLRSKSMVSAGSSGIALVAGFGSRFFWGPRCLSGFYLPSHRLTTRRKLGLSHGLVFLACAAA